MIPHLSALVAHAFHAGELEAGRRACEKLLAMPELPDGIEILTRRNRTWYTQRLDELVATRFVQIDQEPALPGWSLFNPSIVAIGANFLVNVRSSNYQIVAGRYVMPPEDGGAIKTRNLLVELTGELDPIRPRQSLECEYPATDYQVHGLEDVRLNIMPDYQIVASATVRNMAGHDGTCRIATAEVYRHTGRFVGLDCPETADGQHEKNWMPITGRREWVYSANHSGRVCTVANESGRWAVTPRAPAPPISRGFRGSSQLVPIGGGRWLCLIHEVAHERDGRRIYEHRFVCFDETADWEIVGISPPFAFRESRAIEFAAGLARRGDQLVASFGIRDAEAWLVEMNLPEVVRLLEKPA
jgi:predicted GH43/DUF377 family glycosyl hydrolase